MRVYEMLINTQIRTSGPAYCRSQIIRFGVALGGHLGDQVADQIGGFGSSSGGRGRPQSVTQRATPDVLPAPGRRVCTEERLAGS
jgi:hypothetical protein